MLLFLVTTKIIILNTIYYCLVIKMAESESDMKEMKKEHQKTFLRRLKSIKAKNLPAITSKLSSYGGYVNGYHYRVGSVTNLAVPQLGFRAQLDRGSDDCNWWEFLYKQAPPREYDFKFLNKQTLRKWALLEGLDDVELRKKMRSEDLLRMNKDYKMLGYVFKTKVTKEYLEKLVNLMFLFDIVTYSSSSDRDQSQRQQLFQCVEEGRNVKKLESLLESVPESIPRFEQKADILAYAYENVSSGPCFISTACTTAANLPDDCQELQTLRRFRDSYVAQQPRGKELIEEYYRIAPKIVKAIQGRPDAHTCFSKIFEDDILRAVELIQHGNFERALQHYTEMTTRLKSEYGSS